MFEVLFGYGIGTNTNILQNLSKLVLNLFFNKPFVTDSTPFTKKALLDNCILLYACECSAAKV